MDRPTDQPTLVKVLLNSSAISAMEEMAVAEKTTRTRVLCLSVLLRHALREAIKDGDTLLMRDKHGKLYELEIT